MADADEDEPLRLMGLPRDMQARIISLLSAREIARIDCTARAFHTRDVHERESSQCPVVGASSQWPVVEEALRLRAADAGRLVPEVLPRRESSWVQFLLFREKLREADDQSESARSFVDSSAFTQLNTRACEEYLATSLRTQQPQTRAAAQPPSEAQDGYADALAV